MTTGRINQIAAELAADRRRNAADATAAAPGGERRERAARTGRRRRVRRSAWALARADADRLKGRRDPRRAREGRRRRSPTLSRLARTRSPRPGAGLHRTSQPSSGLGVPRAVPNRPRDPELLTVRPTLRLFRTVAFLVGPLAGSRWTSHAGRPLRRLAHRRRLGDGR